MSFLALVLTIKIAVIGCAVAIPFLTFSNARLARLTGVERGGETLFRLYGMAIAALLVGYASAYWTLARCEFPWGMVIMGIVSNGGAAAVLAGTGGWRRSLPLTAFLSAIAMGLAVAAMFPVFAVKPLW